MGRFRLESYGGRSMESGPRGWEGLRRAEEDRVKKIIDDYEETLAALNAVPEDTPDDIRAYEEYRLRKEEKTLVASSSVPYNPGDEELDEEAIVAIDEGDDEFMRFLEEIQSSSFYQSMSMSDIAKDITRDKEVPTQRDVEGADRKMDIDETLNESERRHEKFLDELEI